ncbi:MAG: hypothetical protein KJ550_13115 [Proteobacteria bacterium]|nr:hypothetical protein [Pseudomonadota bacterium]MBU4100297.1 hypothetical protein [Pseudomonadota bacterium]MBU4127649.1 hypothetical protein [Pseudomonadota bacterium]MBU4504383.1 hypothetical protein [Pseudomonadota bacterium]
MSQKHGKLSSPFHNNCSIIKDKTANLPTGDGSLSMIVIDLKDLCF